MQSCGIQVICMNECLYSSSCAHAVGIGELKRNECAIAVHAWFHACFQSITLECYSNMLWLTYVLSIFYHEHGRCPSIPPASSIHFCNSCGNAPHPTSPRMPQAPKPSLNLMRRLHQAARSASYEVAIMHYRGLRQVASIRLRSCTLEGCARLLA
jgi:hypothetical protein